MTETPISPIYHSVSVPRLHEEVVRQIISQVMGGALKPGDSLPSEMVLAQQFGVSRTVIREAIRILSNKGLVEVKHGSGMLIQPPEQWNYLDPTILIEQLRFGRDPHFLSDLLQLRSVVEVEIAALAALHRTDKDLSTLHEQIAGMQAVLDDHKTYTQLDIAFHDTLMNIARNRLFIQVLRPARKALYVARMISSLRPGGPELSEQGHEEIVEAIELQDQEKAREAMRRHIKQFEDDFRTIYSSGFHDDLSDLEKEMYR